MILHSVIGMPSIALSGGAWLTVAELDYLRKDPVRYLLNRGVTRFLEDTAQWTNPSNVYLSGEAAAYQSALDDATQAYLSEEPQESEQWPDALTELSKVVHEIERFSEKCAKTYGRMLFRQITEDPSDMLDGDVPSGTQGGSTFVNVDDTD
ncbi:hypothetical protein I317_03470 [Kwoniella heveanensis CBS 569]|nr:hypothetical protein I317_03470 [Kwoniella heveanensis CBS 569]